MRLRCGVVVEVTADLRSAVAGKLWIVAAGMRRGLEVVPRRLRRRSRVVTVHARAGEMLPACRRATGPVSARSRTRSAGPCGDVRADQLRSWRGAAVRAELECAPSQLRRPGKRSGGSLDRRRSFAVKDDVFCLFEGVLDNLGSLRQQYGLSKSTNEAVLLIEAYKALRDRAPYPPSFMLGLLDGNFAFILFDGNASTLLVASDQDGKVPLFWGITSDGYVAFANDLDLLKGSCGKSLAPFPQGCFYSNSLGGLKSYENPKHKVTAVLANEEEICGATFKVEGRTAVITATY